MAGLVAGPSLCCRQVALDPGRLWWRETRLIFVYLLRLSWVFYGRQSLIVQFSFPFIEDGLNVQGFDFKFSR